MSFDRIINEQSLILTECAISERLRRQTDIESHPLLFNTPLIYDENGRKRLEEVYFSYFEVAEEAGLPLLLCAPTWRIDRERVLEADASLTINRDAVAFMEEFKTRHSSNRCRIITGSLLAPKNDCYSPEYALGRKKAAEFHSWQIDELLRTEVEVIIAQTMPAVSEALGMCDRLSASGKPYIISFVINRFGRVLDGTPLAEAMDTIDQSVTSPPAGYMVNCVYPTFLNARDQSLDFFKRLIGIQANASSKDHDQLDGSELLLQDPLPDWGGNMARLHREYGVKILGGCCGTDHTYLRYLMELL
ncbi:MAG: homocysteine S-methyltransferase family protein [Deltaproteobacteria bacterium]|nr:homocysteine S-methyltransferase family protein [Deltaproteobacteria bacterium]MBW2659974.1 homocysteine S-methyltransferase family protein [Deltaproteobacteria bacterium]